MKISVIGCGYLGAVHAAAMAELGHDVVGIDVDESKITILNSGRSPSFEPDLEDLLVTGIASGRLAFSTDLSLVDAARAHFICVGTPQTVGSDSADLSFLEDATMALAPYVATGDLVIGKSTVPVGTAARLVEKLRQSVPHARLAWNPEFLREGLAVKDSLAPDRLVYGVAPGDVESTAILDEIYAPLLYQGVPRIVTDFATSELVKVSANAFLATKISFINAMAEIADATGADVAQLADALGYDSRIGRSFLNAGVGYGGGCLPKDVRAFRARAQELGVGESLAFLEEIDKINARCRDRAISLAREVLGGSIDGRRIAVLGLAFKPNSDDIRDSPALDVAVRMAGEGATVVCTDPAAIDNARLRAPKLTYVETAAEAAQDCDLVIVFTEWVHYRELDPEFLGSVAANRSIIDGRACLDPARWRDAGWNYRALGRP